MLMMLLHVATEDFAVFLLCFSRKCTSGKESIWIKMKIHLRKKNEPSFEELMIFRTTQNVSRSCLALWVRAFKIQLKHPLTHSNLTFNNVKKSVYLYMCVCVCVCPLYFEELKVLGYSRDRSQAGVLCQVVARREAQLINLTQQNIEIVIWLKEIYPHICVKGTVCRIWWHTGVWLLIATNWIPLAHLSKMLFASLRGHPYTQ